MILSAARTQLRLMLGDQSESVWSDANLNSLLDRANLRMYRRIAQQNQQGPTDLKFWKYPKDAVAIAITGGTSSDYTTTGTDLNQIISFEAALWKLYDSGVTTGTYYNLRLGTSADFADNDIAPGGASSIYDLVSIYPQAAGGYRGYIGGGGVLLSIRPVPTVDLMIKGLVTLELDEDQLSATGDGALLLGGFYTALHEAVLYDAAYLASFKDQSMRKEFVDMREDVLEMNVTRTLIPKEAY